MSIETVPIATFDEDVIFECWRGWLPPYPENDRPMIRIIPRVDYEFQRRVYRESSNREEIPLICDCGNHDSVSVGCGLFPGCSLECGRSMRPEFVVAAPKQRALPNL